MPCDGTTGLTEAQKAEVEQRKKKALAKLEADLLRGKAKLTMGADGKPTIDGWPAAERQGWCDACAYRRLSSEGSSALRMAQARQQSVGQGRMQRGSA